MDIGPAPHTLNNATWPLIQLIASDGVEAAIEHSRLLARGVATPGCQQVSRPLDG